MGIRFNCTCGAAFKIKDKYGGKLVRCKECNKITEAPTLGEQFAQNGAAVPKDKKLAAGAVPPPSFFDTAFIQPEDLNAPVEDTRPKMQTLESYDSHADEPRAEVPIDRDEKPKKKRKPKRKKERAQPEHHEEDEEPGASEPDATTLEEPDEVDDALSALANASKPKRRKKSRRSRRRVSSSTSRAHAAVDVMDPSPKPPDEEPVSLETKAPEVPETPEAPQAEIEEMLAFASAKAHARRARRRAVVYVDPVKTPNKTAEAMKKGFKKFLVLAIDHAKTLAIATGRAAKHLFSGPDAGQINVIANIGPTRSAQAGLVVLVLFVTVGVTGQLVHPDSLGQLNTPLAGVSNWLLPLLLALLPTLMMLCFFGAAQLLGQKPEMEEMNTEESAAEEIESEVVEVTEDAEAVSEETASEEAASEEAADEEEAEQSDQDIEEIGQADEADAVEAEEAEETSPKIQMPNLSWINFKASVFVTGVALLPLIVQSLILMLLSQLSAPVEAALAVQLAISCFLALLVYHALWGVLNLSQRWAFLATPAMLLLAYSLWVVLARAAAA